MLIQFLNYQLGYVFAYLVIHVSLEHHVVSGQGSFVSFTYSVGIWHKCDRGLAQTFIRHISFHNSGHFMNHPVEG